MNPLNHIWPWSQIRRLKGELAEEKRFVDRYIAIILEVDPHYFLRKSIESSPRMNCIITEIEAPK